MSGPGYGATYDLLSSDRVGLLKRCCTMRDDQSMQAGKHRSSDILATAKVVTLDVTGEFMAMTVAMNWTRKSVPTGRRLTEAETSAERIVAHAAACGAAGTLFLAVIITGHDSRQPVARHLPPLLAFSIGYLAVGIASFGWRNQGASVDG